MTRHPRLAVALAVCLGLSGAALAEKKPKEVRGGDGGTFDTSGRYVLSPGEQKLDCKKLNGRIQMRILQLRAEYSDKSQPSQFSQSAQQVVGPAAKVMFGGSTRYGTERTEQLKRDRSVIEAYNGQLLAKNCPQYDLETELKKSPNDPPPSPLRPPQKK